MRFLFAVNIPYPEGRANTRRILTIAKGLVRQGHGVHILLPFARTPQTSPQTIEGVNISWSLIPKTSNVFLNKNKRVKLYIQFISRCLWIFELYKITKKSEFDWLYLYQPSLDGLIAAIIVKSFGRRIVSEYVDLLTPTGYDGLLWRFIYGTQVLADRLVPSYSDVILTISSILGKAYCRRKLNAKIMLFPTLVDTTKFGNGDRYRYRRDFNLGDRPIIAYTGSFVRTEGLRVLVEAVAQVVKRYSDLYLIIAGGSLVPESDNADDLILNFGLQSNATFLGNLLEEDIIDLQASADILVMPKLDDPVNHAGLATKLSEYLASGKAVVASNVGDVEIFIRNELDALLVKPGDRKAIEIALIRLLSDGNLRNKLGENGRKVAINNFDVTLNLNRLIETLSLYD